MRWRWRQKRHATLCSALVDERDGVVVADNGALNGTVGVYAVLGGIDVVSHGSCCRYFGAPLKFMVT